MLTTKSILRTAAAGAVAFAIVILSTGTAQARPNFVKVFKATYPDLAENKDVKINCTVCHPAMDNKKKEHRNNYGVALKKALGVEKEKDSEKIAAALKKIASEKSHVEGKTFGDLIQDGQLPGNSEKAD